MAANRLGDPYPDAKPARAFCEIAQEYLVVEQLVGALVLGSAPAKLLIPDGTGNETLEVIQNPHGIELAQPGKVDESTIQTRRGHGREFKPGGNACRNHHPLLLPSAWFLYLCCWQTEWWQHLFKL